MRMDLPWVVSILLGAVVGGLIVIVLSGSPKQTSRPIPPPVMPEITRQGAPGQVETSPSSPAPGRPARAGGASFPTPGGSEVVVRRAEPPGRLRERQDEYLMVLLQSPGDQKAMAGLIAVQRQFAKDDPITLRRQAAALRDAVARKVETAEHYTPTAMMILAEASLLAALEVERERGIAAAPTATPPSVALATAGPAAVERNVTPRASIQTVPSNPTPRPARTRRRPTPRPPRAVATPPPVVAQPTAAPASIAPPPATPLAQASLDVNEPFFMVQIGPISDAARASEIAAELTLGGYAARVNRPAGGSGYFIVLGPYRRSVAEALARTIRTRYGGLAVAVTPAP